MTTPLEPLIAPLEDECALAIVATAASLADRSIEVQADGAPIAVLDGEGAARFGAEAVNRAVAEGRQPFWTRWFVEEADSSRVCDANILPEWTLDDGDTAYLHSYASAEEAERRATYVCPAEGARLTAIPGQGYGVSALFGLHRTAGRLSLCFFGENGLIARHDQPVPQDARGGRAPQDYASAAVHAYAPDGATSLTIQIVKAPTRAGEDSFLFFTRPRLWRGRSDAASKPALHMPVSLAAALFACPDAELVLVPLVWTSETTNRREISVLERSSGRRLATLDFAPSVSEPFELEMLGLEGAVISARVTRAAAWLLEVKLALWVDQRPVSAQVLRTPCVGDVVRMPLPADGLDGRAHLYQVKRADDGRTLGETADFAPDVLAPGGGLVGGRALPSSIVRSPAMEHRYRALAEAVGVFAHQTPSPSGPRDPAAARLRALARAHEIVVQGFDPPRKDYPVLDFAAEPAPRVSVVIPVHDNFAVTYTCLAALLLAGASASMEVIVVDDGSADRTLELPALAPGVVYIRNAKAEGFVGACNRGAQAARGAFIVFLNNDTEPTVGWLDELLFVFEAFEDVGLAGSKLVYPDGRLQDAGGIVWESGDPWNYGRGGNARDPRYNYARQVDYLSGACIMIPRQLWNDVGGFSQDFAPAYFEDTDLACKVKRAGRRVVYAPASLTYHYEGLSNGTDASAAAGLKRFQEINRPKFKARWAGAFQGNGALGRDVDLAKDRGVRGRVVFFDIDVPRPDESAGGYASFQEIRLFQSLGYKVTFVPIALTHAGRYTEQLQRAAVEVVHAPFFSNVEQFIARRGGEFDLAYITRYQAAARVADPFRAAAPSARLLCNVADLHFLRALRKTLLDPAEAQDLASVAELREVELAALAKVDLALSYSPVEESVLASHLLGVTKVASLPWVLEPAPRAAPLGPREGIAFLGGFAHSPNIAAVEFFVSQVMPLLRRRLPGAPFCIYGSNIAPHLLQLGGEDVVFRGFVQDVEEVFDRCRVFVAPLTYGAGVKGKVLDCLAAGVPAVLSPAAAEGLPIRDGVEALIARTPQEWVEAVAALHEDDALWTRISRGALELAGARFSFKAGREKLRDALRLVGIAADLDPPGLHLTRARPRFPGDRGPRAS